MAELHSRLKTQLHAWDCAALAQACKATSSAARDLRTTAPEQPRALQGLPEAHGDEAPGRFQDQFSALCIVGTKAKRLLTDLSLNLRSQTSGMRKIIVELELEQGEMAREAEPGIGWLYELSRSLKQEDHSQNDYLRDLDAVAQYAHARLKSLLELNALLEKIAVCSHDVLRRRTEWMDQLAKLFVQFEGGWRQDVGGMDPAITNLDPAKARHAVEVHSSLMSLLTGADSAGDALLGAEQRLERHIEAVRRLVNQ